MNVITRVFAFCALLIASLISGFARGFSRIFAGPRLFAASMLLVVSLAAVAQTTTPPAATTIPGTAAATTAATSNAAVAATTYPSYFLSFGSGYVKTNSFPTEGFVSAAIGLGGGNYSITTIDMTSAASTIRTGFAKIFAQSGNFTLLGRVDAGISTVTPIIGSFSGGAILMYNLGGVSSKLKGVYAFGEVRILGASTVTTALPDQVSPGFYAGFGKGFP